MIELSLELSQRVQVLTTHIVTAHPLTILTPGQVPRQGPLALGLPVRQDSVLTIRQIGSTLQVV